MLQAKVHLICGKICSGKTCYAKRLAADLNAVRLSCDDRMLAINPSGLFGDQHEIIGNRIEAELQEESLKLISANRSAILDWGFWTPEKRREIKSFYAEHGVEVVWHYIDVSKERWEQNIVHRNEAIQAGLETGFVVDDGLLAKLNRLFVEPAPHEMDVWYQAD